MNKNYYEMDLEMAEKQMDNMEKLTDKFIAYNEIALMLTHHQTLSIFIERSNSNDFIKLVNRGVKSLEKINRYIYNRI